MLWYSVLPPLIAIAMVLWRREVILALIVALLSAEFLLLVANGGNAVFLSPMNSIDRMIAVSTTPANARILTFSLLIGVLLAFMRESGGVAATVQMLVRKGITKSKKQVGLITMFTGVAIFIESNLSVLTAGILSRGLFDKFSMSRARLAYIIDSTSAPVCILVLLNAWGAFVLALLGNYELDTSAIAILWGTVPLNFYALGTLFVVFYSIITDKVHGPMRQAEEECQQVFFQYQKIEASKARFMLLPMVTMIIAMFAFMLFTGNGVLAQGNGSKSVLYATTIAVVLSYVLLIKEPKYDHKQILELGFKGMNELLPLVTIVWLSLTLGASLKELGTGEFIAGLVGDYLPLTLIVPSLFLAGAIISFSTGTSWGTFAILIPIGMPLIQLLELPPSLVLAAILGGGIFGDHCSPISDTTAISSLAAGCDILTHVRTQLPYALFTGGASLVGYYIASVIML